jgi:hypothetical protein
MDKRRTIFTILVTGALAVTSAVAAFTYRSVSAQAPTPTTVAPSGQTQSDQSAQGMAPSKGARGDHGGGGGYSSSDLATALGITTDQLSAAYQTANTEALKQAVSAGLITQAQADSIAAEADFATQPLHGLERYAGKSTTTATTIDYNALLAKALGITTDKLGAAKQAAATAALDAAVKAGTMTQAQADMIKARQALAADTKFQTAMKTAYEAALKQAVTDGTITQAQADAILAQQANQPAGGDFLGHGMGGGHGRGGPDQNGTAPSSNQAAPSTSSN